MPTVDEWEMLEIERIWTDTQCEHVPLFASVRLEHLGVKE